jgi:hypothetical protein
VTDRIYRKTGQTLRAEFSRGTLALVSVSEHGLAIERNGLFTSRPEPSDIAFEPLVDPGISRIADDLKGDPAVERFTILSGTAIHEVEGGNQWKESFGRIHLSMVNRENRIRVLLDLGAESLNRIDTTLIDRVRTALQQSLVNEPAPIKSIRLLPHVAAALWAVTDSIAEQSTHPAFRFDGDGKEIQPARSAPWPNRFRPSYRVRPTPMPFHIRIPPRGKDSAVAVTAHGVADPFRRDADAITGTLLCSTSSRTFLLPLSLEANFEKRTAFVSDRMTWFPYHAGIWGSETIVAI